MEYPAPIAVVGLLLCGHLSAYQAAKAQIPGNPKIAKSDSAQQGRESTKSHQDQKASADVPPSSDERSAEQKAADANQFRENIEIQRKLVTATLALVAVGILQAGVLVWQAIALSRTLSGIKRQADIMERHTDILKESVEATKSNAEATKENIELIIRKERARLRVDVKALDLTMAGLAHTVGYTVRLHGSTEAHVLECGAEAYVSDSAQPSADSTYIFPMGIPEAITPESRVINKSALIRPKIKLDQADIDSIYAKKAFVHFHGFIKYKDVFDRPPHETRFRYLWKVTDLSGLAVGRPFSYWTKCGSPSDNSET